jgi:DUF4097 and DUF4098 domain-containing protein YvlB
VSFRLVLPAGLATSLKTSNGAVHVRGLGAATDVATSNGRVTVEGARGETRVSTSNGSLDLEGEGVRLSARTSNGRVRVAGSLADGEHVVETSNGSVEVTLPAATRLALDAETSNGSAESEFALDASARDGRGSLRGATGPDPKVRLTIRSSNGSVRVRKAP